MVYVSITEGNQYVKSWIRMDRGPVFLFFFFLFEQKIISRGGAGGTTVRSIPGVQAARMAARCGDRQAPSGGSVQRIRALREHGGRTILAGDFGSQNLINYLFVPDVHADCFAIKLLAVRYSNERQNETIKN